jgi:signal transduction histidine kinase
MTKTPTAEESQSSVARILVVDDDTAVRGAVARSLVRHGHAVVDAATAEEALRHVREREFDVVILEINLRNGDGMDLLKQIKVLAPRTEALVLSGAHSIENAMRSVRAGAFDFIEKPFRDARLIHTVDRANEHRRLRQTPALYQAVQVIFRTRDFERLPEAIVNVSMEVMGADAVTLLLPGLDGKFYVAHAFGLNAEIARTTRITVGEGVAGRVVLTRAPLIIGGDASLHADLAGVTPRTRVRSSIVYPLVHAEEVFGVLTFNRLTDECPFGPADLDKAGVLASQVLLALENARLARQNATVEKLAAVGQLAAGIAHEINTPMQFVGDSLHFLNEAFGDLVRVVDRFDEIIDRLSKAESLDGALAIALEARQLSAEVDLAYVREAVPRALERTADGASRVTHIVQAVKEFGCSDPREEQFADLNQCLQSTLVVSGGEYKHVADVETDFGDLPRVTCHPGELNQVFLSLIVNAAHAIAEAISDSGRRGTIRIRTHADGDCVVVSIEDTGTGIPDAVQAKIFDPFFTTRPVGRGKGLGLSIARSLVEKHGGTLSFETQMGLGSRFSVRLPVARG